MLESGLEDGILFDDARRHWQPEPGAYEPLKYRHFIGMVPTIISFGREVVRPHLAFSYRGFRVAASLYAVNEGGESRIFTAGNLKLAEHIGKYCAEMSVFEEADQLGYNSRIGLVTIGTSDADQIEGVTFMRTPTLLPCEPCSELATVGEAEFEYKDFIPVVTVGATRDVMQVHTDAQIRHMHDRHDTSEVGNYAHPYDPDTWAQERLSSYDGLLANRHLYGAIEAAPKAHELAMMALSAVTL